MALHPDVEKAIEGLIEARVIEQVIIIRQSQRHPVNDEELPKTPKWRVELVIGADRGGGTITGFGDSPSNAFVRAVYTLREKLAERRRHLYQTAEATDRELAQVEGLDIAEIPVEVGGAS